MKIKKILTFLSCLSLGIALLYPMNSLPVFAQNNGGHAQGDSASQGSTRIGYKSRTNSEIGVKLTFYVCEDKDVLNQVNEMRKNGKTSYDILNSYGKNQKVIKKTIYLLKDEYYDKYYTSNTYTVANYYRNNLIGNDDNSSNTADGLESFYYKGVVTSEKGDIVKITNNTAKDGSEIYSVKASTYGLNDLASGYFYKNKNDNANTILTDINNFNDNAVQTIGIDDNDNPQNSKVYKLLSIVTYTKLSNKTWYTMYIEPLMGLNDPNYKLVATPIMAQNEHNFTQNWRPICHIFRSAFRTNLDTKVSDSNLINVGVNYTQIVNGYENSSYGAVFHNYVTPYESEDVPPQMPAIPVYEKYSDGSYSEPITYLTMNENTWKDIYNVINYAQRNDSDPPTQQGSLSNFSSLLSGAKRINEADYELTVKADDTTDNSGIAQVLIDSGKNYSNKYKKNYDRLLISTIKPALSSSTFSVDGVSGDTITTQSGFSTVLLQNKDNEVIKLADYSSVYSNLLTSKSPQTLLTSDLSFKNGQKYSLTGKNAKIYYSGTTMMAQDGTSFSNAVASYTDKGSSITNAELFQDPYSYAVVIEVGGTVPNTYVPNFVFRYTNKTEDGTVEPTQSENLTIPASVTNKTGLMLEYATNPNLTNGALNSYLSTMSEVTFKATGNNSDKIDSSTEDSLLDYLFNGESSTEVDDAKTNLKAVRNLNELRNVINEYLKDSGLSLKEYQAITNPTSKQTYRDKMVSTILNKQKEFEGILLNYQEFLNNPSYKLTQIAGMTSPSQDIFSALGIDTSEVNSIISSAVEYYNGKYSLDYYNDALYGLTEKVAQKFTQKYYSYEYKFTASDGTQATCKPYNSSDTDGLIRDEAIAGSFLAITKDGNEYKAETYNYQYIIPKIYADSLTTYLNTNLNGIKNCTSIAEVQAKVYQAFKNTLLGTIDDCIINNYLSDVLTESGLPQSLINGGLDLSMYLQDVTTGSNLITISKSSVKRSTILDFISTSLPKIQSLTPDSKSILENLLDNDTVNSDTLSNQYTKAYLTFTSLYDNNLIVSNVDDGTGIKSTLDNYTSAHYTSAYDAKFHTSIANKRTGDLSATNTELTVGLNEGAVEISTPIPSILQRSSEYVQADINYNTYGEATAVQKYNDNKDGLVVYFAGNIAKQGTNGTIDPANVQNKKTITEYSLLTGLLNGKSTSYNSNVGTSAGMKSAMTPSELSRQVSGKINAGTVLTVGDVLRYPYSWGISNSTPVADGGGRVYEWQMGKYFQHKNNGSGDGTGDLTVTTDEIDEGNTVIVRYKRTGSGTGTSTDIISYQISKRFGFNCARSCTLTSIPVFTKKVDTTSKNSTLIDTNKLFGNGVTGGSVSMSAIGFGTLTDSKTIDGSVRTTAVLTTKIGTKTTTSTEPAPLLTATTEIDTKKEQRSTTVSIPSMNGLYYSPVSLNSKTDLSSGLVASRYTVSDVNKDANTTGLINLTKCYFMSYQNDNFGGGSLKNNPIPVKVQHIDSYKFITPADNGYYDLAWSSTEVPCNADNTLSYQSNYQLTMDYAGYIELDANYSTDEADKIAEDGVPSAKAGQTLKGILKNNKLVIDSYCIVPVDSKHNLADVKEHWIKDSSLRWKSSDEFINAMNNLVQDIKNNSKVKVDSTVYGVSADSSLTYQRKALGSLANSENDVNKAPTLEHTQVVTSVDINESTPIYPSKIVNDASKAENIKTMNTLTDSFILSAVNSLDRGLTLSYNPETAIDYSIAQCPNDNSDAISTCASVWYNEYTEGLQVVHYRATIDYGEPEFTFTIDKRDSDFRDGTDSKDYFFNDEKDTLIETWQNSFKDFTLLTDNEISFGSDGLIDVNIDTDADAGITISEDANTFMPVLDFSGLNADNSKSILPLSVVQNNTDTTKPLPCLAGHQTQLHIRGSIYDNT